MIDGKLTERGLALEQRMEEIKMEKRARQLANKGLELGVEIFLRTSDKLS